MMTNIRFALLALFVTTTGCAATADDSDDDAVVSVDTTADTQQTREHILLARQVGVATGATESSSGYSCDDRTCTCTGTACDLLAKSGDCGENRLVCGADGSCTCER